MAHVVPVPDELARRGHVLGRDAVADVHEGIAGVGEVPADAALMSRMRPSRAGVSVGAAFAVMLVFMVVMPS